MFRKLIRKSQSFAAVMQDVIAARRHELSVTAPDRAAFAKWMQECKDVLPTLPLHEGYALEVESRDDTAFVVKVRHEWLADSLFVHYDGREKFFYIEGAGYKHLGEAKRILARKLLRYLNLELPLEL